MIGEDCVVHDLVQQPDVSPYFFLAYTNWLLVVTLAVLKFM
jgi:hypothetical protein